MMNKYKQFVVETGQLMRMASWDRNRKSRMGAQKNGNKCSIREQD